MAAEPSVGRAVRVEGAPAPEADLTRALYEQYANQIFRYCLHQLGSREEAEDAVQSTFLNAFRGIKRGVVPELESAWLFKIAHNVCLSRRRTSWRRGRIESPTDFDVVEELTPAPSRRADELIGLQEVLEQMPESQRRAILLREWQGLSYREIAEELDLSQAAVETLIFRARRALASGLEQPPEAKRRIVRGADIGNLLAGLKSLLLGGGAAAKVAATVAVVSAGTVVAAAPVQQHRAHSHARKAVARTAASVTPQAPAAAPVSHVAGPAASPADTGARTHVRPKLQRFAALTFGRIDAAATPDASTLEPPAEPPAPAAPEPSAPAPAAEPVAAQQPVETPRVEPQHAPAAQATAPPASDKRSERSKPETGRSGEAKKDTSSDPGRWKSSLSIGGTTTAPVVTMPVTTTGPAPTVQTTTPQAATTQAPAPATGFSHGNDSKKANSDTRRSAWAAPDAPASGITPPATLSSALEAVPAAAPSGVQSRDSRGER